MSLRWRVAVTFGLASLAVASLVGVVTWNLASGYMLEQREQATRWQATVNARLVDTSLRAGSGGLDELLSGLVVDPGSSILLSTPDGFVNAGRPVDPAALPPELLAPTSGEAVWDAITVNGIPVLAVSVAGSLPGSVFVELFPLVELERILQFLTLVLIAGAVASGLLGIGLGWWASKRALRPLTELTESAAKVAGGDLQVRLPEKVDPDLEPLAKTFNATVDKLERRVRQDARFAGDVSHELRSPLTTMVNSVEILQHRRDAMPLEARQAVDLLGSELDRFQRTVVDLLEISRGDEGFDVRAMESVDLVVLVGKVSESVDGACTPIVERPPPAVLADRRRLVRVVANLLDNAGRHGGGAVRVAVTERDGNARLEVDDDGPGVPAELRQRIFERFARGRQAGERGHDTGSGLGLALVAQHVRLHSGAVWVEDRPGGGARFVVELPPAGPP